MRKRRFSRRRVHLVPRLLISLPEYMMKALKWAGGGGIRVHEGGVYKKQT